MNQDGQEPIGPGGDDVSNIQEAATDGDEPRVAQPATEPDPGAPGDQPEGAPVRKPAPTRSLRARLELPILVVVAILVAIVLKTFVIQPFYIPSASMETTLHGCPSCSGDRILVFKPVYRVRTPHAGDIVVFKAPQAWPEEGGTVLSTNPVVHGIQWFGQLVGIVAPSERDLVKRVIATGGQTIKCCDSSGNVEVADDGVHFRSLHEGYLFENDRLTFGPVTVPTGRIWVMGDHRGDSADSRYHCTPGIESAGDAASRSTCDAVSSTVAISDVIGKSTVIAWPPSRWRTLGTPATFESLGLPGPVAAVTSPAALAFVGVGFIGNRRARRRRRARSVRT